MTSAAIPDTAEPSHDAFRNEQAGDLDPVDAENLRTLGDCARVFFSRPGPRVLAKLAGAAWFGRALFGPPRISDFAICGAVIAYWPFQEWLVHKHLLHLEPREKNGKTIDPFFARKHRAHHREPRDVDLALLPLPVLRRTMPANAFLWLLLSPSKRAALTGIAATSTMTLIYEWTHYLTHTGYKPKTAFFKKVRRNHRMHHFFNEAYWLSFTIPWVDTLLRTDPGVSDIGKSDTARNLHGYDDRAA